MRESKQVRIAVHSAQRVDLRKDLLHLRSSSGVPYVPLQLCVDPAVGTHPKESLQPKGRLRGDATFAVHNFVDMGWCNPQSVSEVPLGYA